MYDLAANPTQPPWLCHSHAHPVPGASFYTHDVHARDGLIFTSHSRGSQAFPPRWDILDGEPLCPEVPGPCGNGLIPRRIASITHDDPDLHAHSSFRMDDPRYLLTCDEIEDGHVRVWDISDPEQPVQVGDYQPDGTCHSVHHVYSKGTLGYAAWYNKGIQVFDLSDPTQPFKLGHYEHPTRWEATPDESCCNVLLGPEGANCAGVPFLDPFLPSGLILATESGGNLLIARYDPLPSNVLDVAEWDVPGFRVTAGPIPGAFRILATLPQATEGGRAASLEILSAGGRRVRVLLPGPGAPGEYRWDGLDESGRRVPRGVYFMKLEGEVPLRGRIVVVP